MMYWLYFMREFYAANAASAAKRAPAAQAPNHRITSSQFVFCAYAEILRYAKPAKVKTLEPVETVQPIASPSPVNTYLQRLSVEGEHAFGIWDEEAGFSMFSANFERVTGISAGECAGHDWIHAIHNDQQYALNEALLNSLSGADGRCLVQISSRLKEDSWRWMMVDIKAPHGSQNQTMVLWRDMSEQKALEETLQQLQTTLAMSERGRSAFLSSMSHELRTPLNAIMGFSEMMKSGVFGPMENPTYAQYAQHIHDSGAALLTKVNDLLDIASMDVGGLELDESEFILPNLLTEVIEIHTHHAFTRGQKIKLDCPHAMILAADRAKLLCAVSHLITNAMRHSAEGAEITVTVRVQADEGLILSVRDAGEGISAAQLEIIRKALASEVAYFNIESGGIGLGLSLAKELTARHGGHMMIDSMRHRGTVVSIILPTERVVSGLPVKKRRERR